MSDNKKPEIRVKFEFGEIKFEAEGSADLVERERSIFINTFLPSAIEAVEHTRFVSQKTKYIDAAEQSLQINAVEEAVEKTDLFPEQVDSENYSYMELIPFLGKYSPLTERDFALFSAHFDEEKNKIEYFTIDDLKRYYDTARRQKPKNISYSLTQLAKNGLIVDATDIEIKRPKPYRVSNQGKTYIKEYQPKEKKASQTRKVRKPQVKTRSKYADLDIDELNLDTYPEVKFLKNFKEKMMMILYIITNEGKDVWFTTADVICLVTDIFGEPATKDQVDGVFRREKPWFKIEAIDENKREVRRKLLNSGIEYAKSLMEGNK